MNIQKMMQEAQKLQNTLMKKLKEFEEQVFTISYKDYVNIEIKGSLEIISYNINKNIVDPDDIEMLSDIIAQATNEAIKTIKTKKDEITNSVNPGLGGMGGLF